MNRLFLPTLGAAVIFSSISKSNTNHFGVGGFFELDLGDSEIPLIPKQKRLKSFKTVSERTTLNTLIKTGFLRPTCSKTSFHVSKS